MKEVRQTLDSIEMEDLRPLATRVFEEAEGLCLIQGNLEQSDIPRSVVLVRGSCCSGGCCGGLHKSVLSLFTPHTVLPHQRVPSFMPRHVEQKHSPAIIP